MEKKYSTSYNKKVPYIKESETIRLNKFLSNSGLCSRREADSHIEMGLVQVNGKIITEMGFQVKPTDLVKFDGQKIEQNPPIYLLLNKPKGFVATAQGGVIKKSVQELIRGTFRQKVPPVGDMGRPMTGLLLLSNEAELRKKISQAKALRMIYKVILDKNIDTDSLKKLKEGVRVFDKEYKIAGISHIEGKSKNEIGVEVDGLNPAILVKLFASVDRKVLQVDRVVIGGLTKKELPRGTWRRLTVKEVSFLKMLQ